MTRNAKIIVIVALMLGMALAALDSTIVGTAMPSIVGKLGGITLYSWVFSAYLLTSTTTVPIYGKLADIYGRKPLFLFGTGLFLLGSVASGAAQSMEQLILFRALQGLGAGAVLPIVLTIIGDIFTMEERARVQGLFSGVWGLSSIVGPALGGLIVDHFSWRWVFFINVPFGLLSVFLLVLTFKERVVHTKPHLDYIGTLTLTASIVALLFATLEGGAAWAWNSLPSIALFVASALLLLLFLRQERRAKDPILPLTLFNSRIIALASVGGVILGVLLFGITSYVPLFIQGVKGGTATSAGVVLGPLLIAWPIAAAISGKLIIRYGYRLIASVGALLAAIGVGMIVLFTIQTGYPFIITAMVFIGLGLGFNSMCYILSVQNAVPWNLRGVATASTQFFRTIGGTIGVAIMGSILNAQMAQQFAPILARSGEVIQRLSKGVAPENILLTPGLRDSLPATILHQLQIALAQSLFWVYALAFVLSIAWLVLMFFMPGGSAEKYAYKEPSTAEDEGVPATGSEALANIG